MIEDQISNECNQPFLRKHGLKVMILIFYTIFDGKGQQNINERICWNCWDTYFFKLYGNYNYSNFLVFSIFENPFEV